MIEAPDELGLVIDVSRMLPTNWNRGALTVRWRPTRGKTWRSSTLHAPCLRDNSVRLLAALPEDRVLYALSVADLGDAVDGEVLTALDRSAELVTAIMLGITGLDRNPVYFSRKEAKAAVLRSRAADLQMAALKTDTRCLILTGEGDVSQSVQNLAEIKNVPVIKVPGTTGDAVARIEEAFAGARFHQAGKLARLGELTGRLELAAV